MAEWQGKDRYGDLKNAVAEEVANFLAVFQQNLADIDEAVLEKKLTESEAAMTRVANETLLRVQKAVGLRI
jgi:tryptophanyl-tRNA synthetase